MNPIWRRHRVLQVAYHLDRAARGEEPVDLEQLRWARRRVRSTLTIGGILFGLVMAFTTWLRISSSEEKLPEQSASTRAQVMFWNAASQGGVLRDADFEAAERYAGDAGTP